MCGEGTPGELACLPFPARCAHPALPISLAERRGTARQPAGSLPGLCAAGFQQFFPASRGPFHYTAFLYGVPGRQPAPLPSHGDFPRWALQTTSVLGPGNPGLCRKEFAGQRVEQSCATLFLLTVTLTWRQHPEGFGNSQPPWLVPLDVFSPCVHPRSLCSQPQATRGADPAVWLSREELGAFAGLKGSPELDGQRTEGLGRGSHGITG